MKKELLKKLNKSLNEKKVVGEDFKWPFIQQNGTIRIRGLTILSKCELQVTNLKVFFLKKRSLKNLRD